MLTAVPPEEQLYKIRTIAELTGFSPTLLRAWERRHRLLKPKRASSTHRLYTEEDLQVLLRVRELLGQGRTIGEVMATGRGELVAHVRRTSSHDDTSELDRIASAVVRAAQELDEGMLTRLLDRTFAAVSVDLALEHVILPAAHRIGELWAEGGLTVASEHLFTATVARRLNSLIEAEARHSSGTVQAFCCCLPNEQHDLGCLMVAHQLLMRNVRVLFLGSSLPIEDLERALEVRRPDQVYISVTRGPVLTENRTRLLQMVRRLGSEIAFILGGQGLAEEDTGELEAAGVYVWVPERALHELDPAAWVPPGKK